MIRLLFSEQKVILLLTSESSKGVGLQLDHDYWDMNEDSEHGDFFLPAVKKKVIQLDIV